MEFAAKGNCAYTMAGLPVTAEEKKRTTRLKKDYGRNKRTREYPIAKTSQDIFQQRRIAVKCGSPFLFCCGGSLKKSQK